MARNGAMTAEANTLLDREPAMTAGEFLAECDQFLARWHTMPKPLSDRRKARLRQVRQEMQQQVGLVRLIAERLGFDPNRFSKLTRPEVATS